MMFRRLSLIFLCSTLSLAAQTERPSQPNIVLILTDDLGWQDVKCYDIDEESHTLTPHIDALATQGVLFRQGYSPAPTCSPSRAAIVSGVHPARSQNTHINGGTPPSVDGNNGNVLVTPWYSGRMPTDQPSIADSLQTAGYATGMTGKWHNSANLYSFPQPTDVGFQWSSHNKAYMQDKYGSEVKGIQSEIVHPDQAKAGKSNKKSKDSRNRPINYSTKDSQYPLDDDGFPIDPVQVDTIAFMEENKDQPFFLFNATWLVHAPIQCRSEAIVKRYYQQYLDEMEQTNTARLAKGEKPLPIEPLLDNRWSVRGFNPFYLGMVETLDHYVGQTIKYLETTDDPRWPGHKLIESTYIILTSDNGGVISARAEQITDNTPLRKGKKYTNEGGIRVPFIIAGPGIPADVDSNVMINGLDLYPTALSWAGVTPEASLALDGADLSTLLAQDPQDASLVRNQAGDERTEMFWHFPHSTQSSSVIRSGNHKLIMNYGAQYIPKLEELELYKLYNNKGKRVDIEEWQNLKSPELKEELKAKLEQYLTEAGATKPYYNPASAAFTDGKNKLIPTIKDVSLTSGANENSALISYKENGAAVSAAYTIYRLSDKEGPEWFRKPAEIDPAEKKITATYPTAATGVVYTLIDENNFIVTKSK